MDFLEWNRWGAALLITGGLLGTSFLLGNLLYPSSSRQSPAITIPDNNDTIESKPRELALLLKAANPQKGAELAARFCRNCHTFEQNGPSFLGPNLFGVMDREIASVRGFSYSEPLQAKRPMRWSDATLMRWLKSPSDFVPGSKMSYAGLQPAAARANIIAYLHTLKSRGTGAQQPGEELARQHCGSCHGFTVTSKNSPAPSLYGIMGRGIARSPLYPYSAALQKKEGVWDRSRMDKWLSSPQSWAPGTNMISPPIPSATLRGQIIDYLQSISPSGKGKPSP